MKITLPSLILCYLLALLDADAQKWDTLSPIPESFTFPVVAEVGGKIHIMGGGGVGGATNHHFAYDPATDTWASRAPVPYHAQQPAGSAANGKIHYFGGGFPTSGSPKADHHIYDPVANSWTKAADLTAPRAIHYSVSLNDVVYSLAGQGMANLCQTYDPVANAWTTKNNLPDNGFWYGAHVASEGHIYRFCGGGYTAPNKFAHRYDIETDSWASLPMFPAATHALRGAAIGNKIYLAGGYHDFIERDEVFVFDTDTETYTPGIPLPLGRNYHNMVSLDSCIYIVGGNHAIDETVKFQLLRFCPFATSQTVEKKPLPLLAYYASGIIYLQMPSEVRGAAQLSIFDMTGKQVFFEKLSSSIEGFQEIPVGELRPAMYVLRLHTDTRAFVGKVAVN